MRRRVETYVTSNPNKVNKSSLKADSLKYNRDLVILIKDSIIIEYVNVNHSITKQTF